MDQPLLLRRRLRPACGARREDSAVHAVRDAPIDWRGGGNSRARCHMADRPAHGRAARWAHGVDSARHLPALLRPHVHEPEGFPLRGRNGDFPARGDACLGTISTGVAGGREPRRHRLRSVVRFTHHGRVRTDRRVRGRRPDLCGRVPRLRHRGRLARGLDIFSWRSCPRCCWHTPSWRWFGRGP